MTNELEQVYQGEVPVRYIFEKASKPSDYLIIIFSAFSAEGKPAEYNYYNTIIKYDCNKLFILDDQGERGCYYLGENRDFFVERSVIKLIDHICYHQNILYDHILACGSSKGGYSAIYFSIKYNFGHVVVCAPQVLLGNFLSSMNSKKSTMNFIAGDRPDSKEFLNKLIFEIIEKSKKFPNISIHVGKDDYHYKDHVKPLIEAFDKKCQSVEIDLGNFSSHNEITFFQRYLNQKIITIIKDYSIKKDWPSIYKLVIEVTTDEGGQHLIKLHTNAEGDCLKYAWYVYKDDQKHYVEWYINSNEIVWTTKETGKYRILAFVKDRKGNTEYETSDYIYL